MRGGWRIAGIVIAGLLWMAPPAAAQTTHLFEDFNGPTLATGLSGGLPTMGPVTYLGTPDYQFQNLGGASVLRMTNTFNGNHQQRGWSTTEAFQLTDFRYEVRFNSMTIGTGSSIDGLINIWVIDAANPSRYDAIGLFAGNFGADRTRQSYSGTEGTLALDSFAFQDNTWYRLIISGSTAQDMRASVLADDGTTELIGHSLGHRSSTYAAGFRLGLSQWIGEPHRPEQTDVAVDYMRLTSTHAVPEPAAFLLFIPALFILLVLRTRWQLQ